MSRLSRRAFLASSVTSVLASGGLRPPLAEASERIDVPATGVANPDLEAFDKLFAKFLAENKVPGAAVAVTRGGKLVYARGFGFADVEKKREVKPDALFRIASISKPVTAVGVMMLAEQGKLKLDEPALKYVKLKPPEGAEFDRRWEKVTIRHCLQHTGGWDRAKKGGFDPIIVPARITQALKLDGAPTADDVVRYMLGQPLDFDPGAKISYSNLGYLVLGRVMETVTGQKYEPWMKKNVLAPVGITSMALGRGVPEKRAKGEVSYYDSKKRTGTCLYPPRAGEKVPLPDGGQNVEGFEAHGGWIASAIDLVRFASALDYGRKSPLLSADSIKEMWARPDGAAGTDAKGEPKAVYYGCGWTVRPIPGSDAIGAAVRGDRARTDAGRANVWHNGLISGTSTHLVRLHDGLNWAALFNTDANPDGKQPSTLIDPLMNETAAGIKKWPEGDLFEKYK